MCHKVWYVVPSKCAVVYLKLLTFTILKFKFNNTNNDPYFYTDSFYTFTSVLV